MKKVTKWFARIGVCGILVLLNFSLYKSYESATNLFYDYAEVKALLADDVHFVSYSDFTKSRLEKHFGYGVGNLKLVENIFIGVAIVSLILIVLILFISIKDLVRSMRRV